MRKTLRRSCDACAKSKLACDLRTPRCSRCAKRDSPCVYANQPLSASPTDSTTVPLSKASPTDEDASVVMFNNPAVQSFDPFDTYPQTRLPRPHVQRLIQHCKLCEAQKRHLRVFLTADSSLSHRIPILSIGSRHHVKSIRRVLVAPCSCRSGTLPCVTSNSIA